MLAERPSMEAGRCGGLNGARISSFYVAGNYLYAGTYGRGIWRCPLSKEVPPEDSTESEIPSRFTLAQNYPNPFNPSTTIAFSLSSRAFVSLKVFDVMGRDVATLVSEELPAGSYTRAWNASGCASGMYFYRLQADFGSKTNKLILLH